MAILKTKTGSDPKLEKMKKDLINPKSYTALNLMIDSQLHKDFKMAATQDGISMTDVLVLAIQDFIHEQKQRGSLNK